jgi:ABC-type transport system involved in multi-copper enzyme maturation permease subunit
MLTVYLVLVSFFIGLVYLFLAEDGSISSGDPSYLQTVGKVIFSTVVLIELLMVSFIGPALTSGAISSERERQTFDLLRTSLLSARALVFGKLSSAVVYLLLLVLTAIPVQSLAFFLGGVGMAEMVISTLMLVVTAVFFCTLGLFFSSFAKRTLVATVSSYGTILLSFIILLVLLFMLSAVNSFYTSTYNSSTLRTDVMNILFWFLFSTNPFFAAAVSEAILIEDQSIFSTTSGFIWGTTSFPLPSPWMIYIAFYVVITILLIWLSIFFVNRPDR